MSDSHSHIFRYSFDKEDLTAYQGWPERYVKQPQVLAYLQHIVERHDLRRDLQLETALLGAHFDEENNVWEVETSRGNFTVRYLITALGLLSKSNVPEIPGLDTFKGEMYHSSQFPDHYNFSTKRVGVIGGGSTGVQIITAVSKNVGRLISFQRHPQYSVPAGDEPISKEERDKINRDWDKIWDHVWNSITAMGVNESTTPAMSVSAEERHRIFQEAWDKGNGFRFMFETFSDITTSEEANEAAAAFIREKIAEIIKDTEKRRLLTPHDLYARRPLCDAGYYQAFNQENVDIVHLGETPIVEVTPNGIRTSAEEYELDALILATGFDAVDGNFNRTKIHGRHGTSLKEHWQYGPSSYLGVFVPGFPNMFMLTGPNGPFTNTPPIIETQGDLVTKLIAEGEGQAVIEATTQAESQWTQICREIANKTLFWKLDTWIFGANIPGKPRTVLFYLGGMQNYRAKIAEMVEEGYTGLKITKSIAQTGGDWQGTHHQQIDIRA
ncbi:hypothetical protein LTR10_018232 [Elasticomyces elasticus]|uniref:FAD/NAD(P)-binding domain-containing protein n=1 Tax=Exophiala sideris TaxID=1016849 RepID=A0ABR0JIT6_9EURO|nr:hypothetical protein LTR10_018232 [Elasticomyces elasticus]KAK5034527.1 hypothetical protein LTS07_003448 [Exophiala sideris]KAK5042823.1 hypothetical protein LTR13_001671 [Exophiala sideris]KAK5065906.1 hypothetical protein LTR69_003456 [Exophiala sideris]KAK5185633.1 hypothetical protein LTR44_001682 [Eurotiomycetes sp. CCFEE 6388]